MAGLLDLLGSDTGLLGLQLMAAGSAKPVKTGFGEGLLGALQNVQAQRAAEEEKRQRAAMQQLQMQSMQQTLQAQQQAAEERKAQAAAQQAAAQQRGGYLDSIDASQGPAMPFNPVSAMRAGLRPEEMKMLGPQEQESPYAKLNPGDFTPESFAEFAVTKDYARLRKAEPKEKPEATPASIREYQFAVGQGYKGSFEQWDTTRKRAGATNVTVGDRIPPQLVKQQDELIDKMTTAKATDADLGGLAKQIDSGTLKFGPVRNLVNTGKNIAGYSDEESRAFGTFKSTLEKLRNDSLRLNAGVQTEGDAQRSWNELFQNINDTKFVGQRLQEIRAINQRAAKLHEYRLGVLRSNSGAGALTSPNIEPVIKPGAASVVRSGVDAQGRKVQQMSDGSIRYAD